MTRQDGPRASPRGELALADAVITAVQTFLERDAYLLWADVNERTMPPRLAIDVDKAFVGTDVDCECDRDGHGPKQIAMDADAALASRALNDVIGHRRGSGDHDLVFELTKSNNPESEDRDVDKLRGYRVQPGHCHGVFPRLIVRSDPPCVGCAEFVYGDA